MGITRLRLARFGCRNRPFYRIVAIDSRKARDAKPIEYVGTYDPIPYGPDTTKEVRLRIDRIKYWLSVGAQPSDRVAYLFWRAGLMPAPPLRWQPAQSVPKETRRAAAKAAKFHTMTDARAAAAAAGALRASPVVAGAAVAALAPARFAGAFVRVVPAFLR